MTNRNFGFESTTNDVLEGVDLTGQTFLITGGSSGLGAESVRAIASKGAHVIVTARNLDKALAVIDEIKATTGNEKIDLEELELGSIANIREAAQRVNIKYPTINVLINNAGVMACPYGETSDGFEQQFGANHLGHFLFTNLIMPTLIKGAKASDKGARIISLSSSGHNFSPVVFEDIFFKERPYHKWLSYGQSKTANALFAVGLNARLKDRGIEAFSVHPGAIMTDLARHMTDEDWEMFQERMESSTFVPKTVEQGAATQVFAATAPEIAGKGGSYLADVQIAEVTEDGDQFTTVKPYAVDPVSAEKLWTMSEELLGQGFAY